MYAYGPVEACIYGGPAVAREPGVAVPCRRSYYACGAVHFADPGIICISYEDIALVHARRQLTDPKRLFDRLTDESLASAGPDSTQVEPPSAESAIDQAATETEQEELPESPTEPKKP